MLKAALIADDKLVIVTAARSDLVGPFLTAGSMDLWSELFHISRMNRTQLRQVINGPAEFVGVRLEEGLDDEMLNDASGEDGLPLLSLVLHQLWSQREVLRNVTVHVVS